MDAAPDQVERPKHVALDTQQERMEEKSGSTKVEKSPSVLVAVEETVDTDPMGIVSRQLEGLAFRETPDTYQEMDEKEEAPQMKSECLQDEVVEVFKSQHSGSGSASVITQTQAESPVPLQVLPPAPRDVPIFQATTIREELGKGRGGRTVIEASRISTIIDDEASFKGDTQKQKRTEMVGDEEFEITQDFKLPAAIDVQPESLDFSENARKISRIRTRCSTVCSETPGSSDAWTDWEHGDSEALESQLDDSPKRTKGANIDVKDLELLGHENLNELGLRLQRLHNSSLSRGDKALIEDLDEKVILRMGRNEKKTELDAKRFEENIERTKKKLPEVRGLEQLRAHMMTLQKGTTIGKGGVFQLGGVKKPDKS